MAIFPVVLVVSYMLLTPSFILPIASDDNLKLDNVTLADNKIKSIKKKLIEVGDQGKYKHNSSKEKQSLQNIANINETELYQEVTSKSNNVNERSFVYLNQKYKNPYYFLLKQARVMKERKFPAIITNLDSDYNMKDFTDRFYAAKTGQVPVDNGLINGENGLKNITYDITDNLAFVELLQPPILRANYNFKPKSEHRPLPSPVEQTQSTMSPNTNRALSKNKTITGYGSDYKEVKKQAQFSETVPRENKEHFLTKVTISKNSVKQDSRDKKIENKYMRTYTEDQLNNAQIQHNSQDCPRCRSTYKHKKTSRCRGSHAKVQDCNCNTKTKGASGSNVKRTSLEDYETIINQGLSKIISSTELMEVEDVMEYSPSDE